MYIEHVPNRNSPPAILLRESYRDANKVKKRTLANLSSLPAEVIEGLKVLLRGGVAVPSVDDAFVIAPASKLATHRMLRDETATHSLSRLLKLGEVGLDDVYAALDWLGEAQAGIEKRLARQHLAGHTLVLYDLTSTWVTGRCCELAARGYSRDGKRDDPQIVFGLICTSEGIPVAVEVFAGNTPIRLPWRPRSRSSKTATGSTSSPGWATGACSRKPVSIRSCARPGWTG